MPPKTTIQSFTEYAAKCADPSSPKSADSLSGLVENFRSKTGLSVVEIDHGCIVKDYQSLEKLRTELASLLPFQEPLKQDALRLDDGVDTPLRLGARIYMTDDTIMRLSFHNSTYVEIEVYMFSTAPPGLGEHLARDIKKLCDKYTFFKPEAFSKFQIVVSTPRGITTIQKDIGKVEFHPDNYALESVDKYQKLVDYMSVGNSLGRLTILQGPPGTGKTMFVRSLLDSASQSIYLPVSVAIELAGPSFISVLEGAEVPKQEGDTLQPWRKKKKKAASKKLLLIIEDGDVLLQKRSSGSSVVSEFLNFADGLLGEAYNLHILVSTNLHRTDFDPAITRPGRLHSLISFETLTAAQAQVIYKRETGETAPALKKSDYTLGDIYQWIYDNQTEQPTDKSYGQYL